MKRHGAAAFILNDKGEVLLVKHNYGHLNWELPGGRAESNESVADTAIREVREETGLAAVAESLSGIYYEADTDAHHFVYRCRVSPDSLPEASPDEISECGYWPVTALPRPMSDFTIRRVEDGLKEGTVPLPVPIGPRQWLE